MPIEVRELIIKATVQQETGGPGKIGGAGTNNTVSPNEELLQSCIEKMMEIIKDKYER
jgi:Family of unknown function (DUF5908)